LEVFSFQHVAFNAFYFERSRIFFNKIAEIFPPTLAPRPFFRYNGDALILALTAPRFKRFWSFFDKKTRAAVRRVAIPLRFDIYGARRRVFLRFSFLPIYGARNANKR